MSFTIHVLGILADLINRTMYIGTLIQIKEIRKNCSSENIALTFQVLMFLNCLAWTVYGFEEGNIYMMIPNIIGLILIPILIHQIIKYK
jgi:uncharacterized protein with PQ loop repeat